MYNDIDDDGYYLSVMDDGLSVMEAIAELDEDDMMAVAEEDIAQRGYEYYRSGYVSRWEACSEEVTASVKGSYGNHYRVTLYKDDLDLLGQCTCPYDDTCKHIVATLFYLKEQMCQKLGTKNDKTEEEMIARKELENMEKGELVDLVMKYAPESYKKSIVVQYLSKDAVSHSLDKIAKVLKRVLRSNEFMYDPHGLFDFLSSSFDDLSAHIKVAPEETFKIIFSTLRDVEEMEEEGYLYQDSCNWYEEGDNFEYEIFSDKILQMIHSLEDSSAQAKVLLQYLKLCDRSNYFYCSLNAVQVKDKSLLTSGINEIKTLDFYDFIKSELSYEDRLSYLNDLHTDRIIPRIVETYWEAGEKDKALAYVEALLEEKFTVDNALLLLDMKPENTMEKEQLCALVKRAILSRDLKAYDFVMSYMAQCGKTEELEELMKKEKIHWYYQYLEKHHRVEEMHAILEKVSHEKGKFYHKYKMQYREEAIAFYKACINKDLSFTGNSYYENIAGYLKELKPLMADEEFSNMIMYLKTHYKRRRNFVKILNAHFA